MGENALTIQSCSSIEFSSPANETANLTSVKKLYFKEEFSFLVSFFYMISLILY